MAPPRKRQARNGKPRRPEQPVAAIKPARRETASGWIVAFLNEAVLAEAETWPTPVRAQLGAIIRKIEADGLMAIPPVYRDHIRGKIWELRPDGMGVEGRAFYVAVAVKRVVIVLCKIKRRPATPPSWIKLAEARAATIDKEMTE